MKTAEPDSCFPAPTRARLTLVDWMDAHRAVIEEEQRLNDLATRHCQQREGADALERQRMRVQVAQDAADAIYDAVMQELRAS